MGSSLERLPYHCHVFQSLYVLNGNSLNPGFHELYVVAKNVLNDLPVKKACLTYLERRVAELCLENLDKESLYSTVNATLSKLQEQLEMGYLQIQLFRLKQVGSDMYCVSSY